MEYVREPKNVDLVVGPSILTEDTKNNIARAIAQYRKTGKKPDSVKFITQASVKIETHTGRKESTYKQLRDVISRKAKI